MANNKISKELKEIQKKIDNLTKKKEQKEQEIKAIDEDITKYKKELKEALKVETAEKISNVMFNVHDFSSEQAEKLINLIESLGSGIADIDPQTAKFTENAFKEDFSVNDKNNENAETTSSTAKADKKVDTSINFSDGEKK